MSLIFQEKSEEKVNLVANHEKVQQKVDKIIDTLKLVEDTSEWEDGFNAALEATQTQTNTKSSEQQSSPSEQTTDQQINIKEEQMDAEESIEDPEEEAMNVETSKAAEQLEQLNKQENQSLELGTDSEENQLYELECHENGADMYDIFVEEEVHESVDMVSETGVNYFESHRQSSPVEQHIKGQEFSQEEHQVMLYTN